MPLKKHLIYLPFFLLAFFIGFPVDTCMAQEENNNYFIIGVVKDKESAKKLEGVTITVLQNGSQFDEITTSRSGKYEFYLPLGENYDIIFSKDDYLSKKVRLETQDIPEEDRIGGFRTDLDMTLFVKPEGFDESITSKPIGIARFDERTNAIAWDFEYTEKVQKEIDEELERIEEYAEKKEEMQGEFDKLVEKGDDEVQKEKFSDGIAYYEEALEIFPDDEPVQTKLSDAQAKLAAKEAAEELDANYNHLVELGEENMQAGKLEEAKTNFEDALDLKPDESLPKAKIEEIEALIAKQEANEEYDSIIAEADENFDSKNYSEAITKYEAALEVKPDENYPKNRKDEAQQLMEEIEEAEELQAEYDNLIASADELFDSKSYQESIAKYEEASQLMPNETYPKNRITEAQNKMEQREEMAEAEELQAQYDEIIASADDLFDSESYEEAIPKYEEAAALMPDEKYPKDRISEAQSKIEERDARLAAREEAASAEELEEQYQTLLSEGEDLFAEESFEAAKEKFREASELKPEENLPKQKMVDIDQAIKDKEAEMLAEEKQAEQEARQAEIDQEYQALINQANEKFDQEDLESAKSDYQAALELKPKERYPQTRISRIEEIIAQNEQSAEAEQLAEERRAEEQAQREAEEKARREQEAQQRLAEDQRLAALEEEKREKERLAEEQRQQKEEDRNKERDLLSNVDTSQEDEVEEFYRTARKSELAARDQQINNQKVEHQEYMADLADRAEDNREENIREINNKEDKRQEIHRKGREVLDEKRQSNRDLQEMHNENLDIYADSSDRRRSYNLGEAQRKADSYSSLSEKNEQSENQQREVKEQKEIYQQNQENYRKKGDALRTDQEYQVQRQREKLENMKTDGEDQRQENIQYTNDKEEAYAELQSDFSKAAQERRMANYEKVEEKRMNQDIIGMNNQGMPGNDYDEIERIKKRQQNFFQTKERESELTRELNYTESHQKQKADPPSYDDYNLPEGGEELAEGVTETSYDIVGGRTVIERSVRIGNKVNIYKKVISKNSTYYFKNDRSITEATWKQSTLQ